MLLSHTATTTCDSDIDATATATAAASTPVLVLSQVLCQIHMSRLMLRAAHAGNGSSQRGPSRYSTSSSVNKGINRINNSRTQIGEDRSMCGGHDGGVYKTGAAAAARSTPTTTARSDAMRAWGHDAAAGNKEDHERFLDTSRRAHDNQVEVFETHKFTLQRLLNRLERLIGVDCLLVSVACLLKAPLAMLTTDAGLAIISRFSMTVLNGELRDARLEAGQLKNPRCDDDEECGDGEGSGTEHLDRLMASVTATSVSRDPDELFVPLLEMCRGSTSPHATHRAEDLQCQLLALIPMLFVREEQLRKANVPLDLAWVTTGLKKNQTGVASTPTAIPTRENRQSVEPSECVGGDSPAATLAAALSGRLGATLDRQGCAVLLLILLALLESTVQYARLNAGGDLSEMASDAFLQRVSTGIVTGTYPPFTIHQYNLSRTSKLITDTFPAECNQLNNIAIVHGGSNDDRGTDASDDSACAGTLVRLFSGIERLALSVQDVTLAAASLRVLSSLATGSALLHRCSSTAWALSCTLHTQHTSLLPHLLPSGGGAGVSTERGVAGQVSISDGNLHMPGTDSLWPRLASLVSPVQWPALSAMEAELFGRGDAIDGDGKATKAAWKGLRLLAIAPTTSGGGSRTDSLPLARSAQEVFFFRLFWSSWWASEAPAQRIHGVMFLLHEIFRVHLLSGVDVFRDQATTQEIELGRKKSTTADVAYKKGGGTRNAKAGAKGGHASTISGLALSTLSGPTFDTTMTAAVFPTLSSETLEPIFSIAISSFPALFLFAQPRSRPGSDPLVDCIASNPYQSFLCVTRGYMWLLRRLEAVLADGTQMQFLLRVSTLCVRVCKATLLSVEVAVAHAIAWRSRQRHRTAADPTTCSAPRVAKSGSNSVARGRSDDEEQEAHSSDDENGRGEEDDSHGDDAGSLEHVAVLLDWALALTHAVIHFSETLKSTFLFHDSGGTSNKKTATPPSRGSTASRGRRTKGGTLRGRDSARSPSAFVVPKELSRSTPQLQFAAERLAARLLRSAKTLSMRLRDPEVVVVGNAWEKQLMRHAVEFNQSQRACVEKPVTSSVWRPEAPPGQYYDDCEGVDGGDIFDLRSGRASKLATTGDNKKNRGNDKTKTGVHDYGEDSGIDGMHRPSNDHRSSSSSWERARARVTSQSDDENSDSLSEHDDASDDDDDDDDDNDDDSEDGFEFVARTQSRRSSSGWGLYNANADDDDGDDDGDDDEDEDEDEDEEEETEERYDDDGGHDEDQGEHKRRKIVDEEEEDEENDDDRVIPRVRPGTLVFRPYK